MNALSIVILILVFLYMVFNFKHDIHMLQQNSYRISRYWRWLKGDISSAWRLIDVAAIFLLMASSLLPFQFAALIVAIICFTKTYFILTKKYKKPLVFTKRVWRIYILTAAIALGAVIPIACIFGKETFPPIYTGYQLTIVLALLICVFSWAIVIFSVFVLSPVEKHINNGFINDAKRILKSMPDLKVIGITGSYGKTSTKHFLYRILSEHYETLMTPGSYNTPMGVVRTVREMMKPYTQIFICEMGAKQKGDIKEICDIVHPQTGIISAVGPMHLETFKSIENVQATKFELADALPSDGFLVINDDFEYIANRRVDNVETVRYAVDNDKNADYRVRDISYGPMGTYFVIEDKKGNRMEFTTPLVGEGNISNLTAAIIVAMHYEVPMDKIRYAVTRMEQVIHRLSMATTPGGVTIIDDAFNSNPSGAKMAVDVLAGFKNEGKTIIVTPGMIELGEKQYDLNKAFGRYLGDRVDIAVIVGQYNRDAIVEGINETKMPQENLYIVDSFEEAQKVLPSFLRSGDVLLYENDLPDSFK